MKTTGEFAVGSGLEPAPQGSETADIFGLWFLNDATARVLVAADCAVLHVNRAAEQLIRSDSLWPMRGGVVVIPDGDKARVKAHAAAGRSDQLLLKHMAVTVQRLRDDGVLALTLRPTPGAGRHGTGGLAEQFGLTRTEQQVLLLLIGGCSVQEVAGRLNSSVLTVRTHVKRLHLKLGVSSKEQLFACVLPFIRRE